MGFEPIENATGEMFIIQGHRFAHNGRVMNIILGADYADYTDSFSVI